MRDAAEDLKALLELQREWCQEYGYRYLSTAVVERHGFANTGIDDPDFLDVRIGYDDETPGTAIPGEPGN